MVGVVSTRVYVHVYIIYINIYTGPSNYLVANIQCHAPHVYNSWIWFGK